MNEKEAIEWLKILQTSGRFELKSDKALQMGIDSLCKQNAKKPVKLVNGYYCPTCDNFLVFTFDAITRFNAYCSYCGQKIDYSEDD